MSSTFAVLLAQVTNVAGTGAATDAAAAGDRPAWTSFLLFGVMFVALYFLFIRPTSIAQKKKAETVKTAKTGDKIITSSGIHGVISNVKDKTVIVKVSDNVKLEIEKSHIDQIIKSSSDDEKTATVVKA